MAMRKLGVEEWLVSAVMSVYTGAKTVVRTVYGNSNGFEVKVGMHQGSPLRADFTNSSQLAGLLNANYFKPTAQLRISPTKVNFCPTPVSSMSG